MLKNIRLHIEKDEQKQALLDEKLASHILETHNSNISVGKSVVIKVSYTAIRCFNGVPSAWEQQLRVDNATRMLNSQI